MPLLKCSACGQTSRPGQESWGGTHLRWSCPGAQLIPLPGTSDGASDDAAPGAPGQTSTSKGQTQQAKHPRQAEEQKLSPASKRHQSSAGSARQSGESSRVNNGSATASRQQQGPSAPSSSAGNHAPAGLQYPSRATSHADAPLGWLYAHAARQSWTEDLDASKVSACQDAWQAARAQGIKGAEAARAIEGIAEAYACLSGKWLIFVAASKVDATWQAIAQAVREDRLGPAAKVSAAWAAAAGGAPGLGGAGAGGGSSGGQPLYVICVYTKDFTDQADVTRVREELRRLGVTKRLSYKADIYTSLEIYAGNAKEFGLKVSLYSS